MLYKPLKFGVIAFGIGLLTSCLSLISCDNGLQTKSSEVVTQRDAQLVKVSFGICSDVHNDVMHDGNQRMEKFIDAMNRKKVDFIIQLGDFCSPWARNDDFLAIWNQFEGPRYHVLGNHDTDGNTVDEFSKEQTMAYWQMPARYYSFDVDGYHFVVLDGNEREPGPREGYPRYISPEQQNWLKGDLSQTDKYTIVFSHQGLTNTDGIKNQEQIRTILEEANKQAGFNKVVVCFAGHHHSDYHTEINGIHYIQINSMSYYWVGGDYTQARYSEEIEEAHSDLKYTIPYRYPLYALVTLRPDGILEMKGTSSVFVPPGPAELGLPQKEEDKKPSARISDVRFSFR